MKVLPIQSLSLVEYSPEKLASAVQLRPWPPSFQRTYRKSGDRKLAKSPTVDHPRLLNETSSGFLVQTHGVDHLGLGLHALVHARVRVDLEQD
jgi:hypothetical protein